MPKGDIAEDRPKISLFRKAGHIEPASVLGRVVPLDYLFPRDVAKACVKHGVTTLAAVLTKTALR